MKKRTVFPHLESALLVALLLPPLLHAQQQPFPIQVQPPQIPNESEILSEDPYWRETVENAIEQYESENPDIRRSAIMLLGKYPVPPAQETVAKALEDSEAAVRQAALVSVLEEQTQIPPAAQRKLIGLLDDPSVSIRRIASNSLPMMLSQFAYVMQPETSQMARQLPADVLKIVQQAFRDDDASVRRNMVTNYLFLRISLPQATIISLLHDEDPQVAIHSLQWALPLLQPQNLRREIEKLIKNENPDFRLELARTLQSRLSPDLIPALEKLQNDSDPRVALEAKLALFNRDPRAESYEKIVEQWESSGKPAGIGNRIIFAAQLLGGEGEPFLRKWLEASEPEIRQQAAQVYFSRFGSQAESDFLIDLLNDSLQTVRQQAIQTLIRKRNQISEKEVLKVAANRHPDVRRSAADLTHFLKSEEAEEILLDLLLDNESTVQAAALEQIARRKIEGWEEILSISLESGDPIASRAALQSLLNQPNPQSIELLQNYISENPRSPWRAQIEAFLRKHRISQ